MFFFGATYYIDYDGYWHVFIARLDWRNMLVDSKATAHPPLFFLLLKAVTKFGASRLVYRLISILSGIGATFLIGQIAHKVTGSTALASLTAFIFGLSQSTLAVACEVRSYMLCSFFVLVSFYLYLVSVAKRLKWAYSRASVHTPRRLNGCRGCGVAQISLATG